jgi:uncharacterized protein (UPF0332 family)
MRQAERALDEADLPLRDQKAEGACSRAYCAMRDAAHGRAFNKVNEMRLLADYSDQRLPLDKAQGAVEQGEALFAAVRDVIAGLKP